MIDIDVIQANNSTHQVIDQLMVELQEDRINGKIRDTLIFVEHPEIVTIGRRGMLDGLTAPDNFPSSQVDRGGGLTWHGPGQLVGYPIFLWKEESIKEVKDITYVYDLYKKKVFNQFKSSLIYTDKNLFNYMYCPIISHYFPGAKIINCMRNPLDNILSIYRANFLNQSFSFSLQDISNLYIHYFETMEEYKIKYSESIYNYSYENLIKKPNDVIPEIINWLNWDWNEKYLSPHENKRNVFTASSAQIRKKFYSSSIGIWKEYKELLEPAIEIIKTNKILRSKI